MGLLEIFGLSTFLVFRVSRLKIFWKFSLLSILQKSKQKLSKLLKLSTYVKNLKIFNIFDIFPKILVCFWPKFWKMSKIILKHLKNWRFLSKISLKNGQKFWKLYQKFRTFWLSTWFLEPKPIPKMYRNFQTFFLQKAV